MGSATDSVQHRQGGGVSAASLALIGTEQVTLPINASVTLHGTGPANMIARFTCLASADVSLTATTGADPSFGSTYSAGILQLSLISGAFPFGLVSLGATTSQTLTAVTAPIGTDPSLTFDGFDPWLGVLDSLTVSVNTDAVGSVALEILDPTAWSATVCRTAAVIVAGADGHALASSSALFTNTRTPAVFDGTEDFSGASSAVLTEFAPASATTTVGQTIQGAGLSAFESGPVTLSVERTGSSTIDGPGNLNIGTTLQAGAEVTVTYH